jgi:cation transport regulator ChaC
MTRIFGYGSLIWRPDFPYASRRAAWLPGWQRRFWQASTDHRGTPEAPGRVVTLVPDQAAACAGVLYEIDAAHSPQVLARLDHREKGGYERLVTHAHLADGTVIDQVLVYHGTPDNPHYVGPEPDAAVAAIIKHSHGPSGSNLEYLLKLAEALAQLDEHDAHVKKLVALVSA